MRFLVLGSPVVVGDHGGVPLGPPEQQALLVALVLNANRPLPAYRLIDGVWRHRTPSALTDLRVAVNGLHEALGAVDRGLAARLVQAGGGYLLRLNLEEADNLQFLHLLGQGKAALAADDFYAASHLFTEAMSLWRGAAGAGASAHGWLRQQLDELEDLRTTTIQRVVKASMGLDQLEPEPTGSTAPAATRSPVRVDPSRARVSWSGGRPKSSRGKGRVASRAGR